MATGGPILILEDDREDIELLNEAFKELRVSNRVQYFDDGKEMLDFLRTTPEQPFLIISNVKVSGMDGLELRQEIQNDETLKKKGIPFVYLSLDARKEVVDKAFELTVQGFFEKEDTLEGIRKQLEKIVDYWATCKHPNS